MDNLQSNMFQSSDQGSIAIPLGACDEDGASGLISTQFASYLHEKGTCLRELKTFELGAFIAVIVETLDNIDVYSQSKGVIRGKLTNHFKPGMYVGKQK